MISYSRSAPILPLSQVVSRKTSIGKSSILKESPNLKNASRIVISGDKELHPPQTKDTSFIPKSYKSPKSGKSPFRDKRFTSANNSNTGTSMNSSKANSLANLLKGSDTPHVKLKEDEIQIQIGNSKRIRNSLFSFNEFHIKPLASSSSKRKENKTQTAHDYFKSGSMRVRRSEDKNERLKGLDITKSKVTKKGQIEDNNKQYHMNRYHVKSVNDREVINNSERTRMYNFLLNNYVTGMIIDKKENRAFKEGMLYERA